jgi:hypothetical protein
MDDLAGWSDGLGTEVPVSTVRMLLITCMENVFWLFILSVAVALITGRPEAMAGTVAGLVLGLGYTLLRRRNASLRLDEGVLWGPTRGLKDRLRIDIEDVVRERSGGVGWASRLFGHRRIRSRSGREIQYNRHWYDPGRLETLLMRIGLD